MTAANASPLRPNVGCGDIRTDRFYHADAHGAFGVTVRNGTCGLARSVAGPFAHDYRVFAATSARPGGSPNNVGGWLCTSGPSKRGRMQWAGLSCRRQQTTVTFDLAIPNG
jgi:hypothetical protein